MESTGPAPKDVLGSSIAPVKTETVTVLPSVDLGGPALPAWVPPSFDLVGAAAGMKRLLEQQGVPVTRVRELVVTDADDTLVQTDAKTLLRNAKTGELAKNPVTGELLRIGAEIDAERAALEQQFPQLPWKDLLNDFREFDDAQRLAKAAPIGETIAALRGEASREDMRRFLITARNADGVLGTLQRFSEQQGLGLDSVLSANRPGELAAMSLGGVKLGTAERKALMIAALVELYRPKHAALEHVTFYDDSDGNLAAAKELLPRLFSKTRFDFVDVVRQVDGTYALQSR
jgi:hypothetical protein